LWKPEKIGEDILAMEATSKSKREECSKEMIKFTFYEFERKKLSTNNEWAYNTQLIESDQKNKF
jgi:hypothetical protein